MLHQTNTEHQTTNTEHSSLALIKLLIGIKCKVQSIQGSLVLVYFYILNNNRGKPGREIKT